MDSDDVVLYPPAEWFDDPAARDAAPTAQAVQPVTTAAAPAASPPQPPQLVVVEHWVMVPTRQRLSKPQRVWAWITPQRWVSTILASIAVMAVASQLWVWAHPVGIAVGWLLMALGATFYVAGLLLLFVRWWVPLSWKAKVVLARIVVVVAAVAAVAALTLVTVGLAVPSTSQQSQQQRK